MSQYFRISIYIILVFSSVSSIIKRISPDNTIRAQSSPITLDYPAQLLNIPPNAPQGELAYLLRVNKPLLKAGQVPLDLVFHSTGNDGDQNKLISTNHISSKMAYPYSLTFSPAGSSLLIKTSYPTAWLDAYQISFWNLESKTFKQGPEIKYYPDTCWSPDDHFLAYFQGGDANGDETKYAKPLKLYIYSLSSGNSRIVVQNPMAKSFSWTSKDTVLYGFQPQSNHDVTEDNISSRPSIFESKIPPAVPIKIIQDGFDPIPSPDNIWIAFKGWSDLSQSSKLLKSAKQKKTERPLPFGLYLFNRATKTRFFIHPLPVSASNENFVWSRDSRRLFSIRNIYHSTHPPFFSSTDQKDYPGTGKGHLAVIDVPTLAQHEITVLNATDSVARINPGTQFSIQGISRDGKSLFVRMNEKHKQYQYDILLSVDIQSGAAQTIFDGQDVSEIDWHEAIAQPLEKNTKLLH